MLSFVYNKSALIRCTRASPPSVLFLQFASPWRFTPVFRFGTYLCFTACQRQKGSQAQHCEA